MSSSNGCFEVLRQGDTFGVFDTKRNDRLLRGYSPSGAIAIFDKPTFASRIERVLATRAPITLLNKPEDASSFTPRERLALGVYIAAGRIGLHMPDNQAVIAYSDLHDLSTQERLKGMEADWLEGIEEELYVRRLGATILVSQLELAQAV